MGKLHGESLQTQVPGWFLPWEADKNLLGQEPALNFPRSSARFPPQLRAVSLRGYTHSQYLYSDRSPKSVLPPETLVCDLGLRLLRPCPLSPIPVIAPCPGWHLWTPPPSPPVAFLDSCNPAATLLHKALEHLGAVTLGWHLVGPCEFLWNECVNAYV